jgi:hypothetical protein
MIGYHPAIGQIDAFLKLYCDHLGIHLHNNPLQPIPDSLIISVMIAIYFYAISYVILLLQVRGMCEM